MLPPLPDEVVSMVLALEEVAGKRPSPLGERGMQFMCKEAARLIRRLRPDLRFVEDDSE